MLYFRDKKCPINSKAEGKKKGWPGEIRVLEKGPNQFEGGGEKKGWPGEVKVPKIFPE